MLPKGFTILDDPRMQYAMDYCTHDNFLGRPVAGYLDPVCILSETTKIALCNVQDELESLKLGYFLKIFDTYRPARAVADFMEWSQDPQDQKMKATFYPHIEKSDLFKLGYLAEKSSHSRGSAVDLTIAQKINENQSSINNARELEMGTAFDYFDATAHTAASNISELSKKNRGFLINIMHNHGFVNYPMEWWHFTLKNEPFPDTYFDFSVKKYD